MRASDLWLGVAVIRGIESLRPEEDRLFHDRLSLELLPSGWRHFIGLLESVKLLDAVMAMRERQCPGVIGNVLCRTRFIDDVILERLAAGLEQVVLLGAGFDTRAYRIPGIDEILVYEVDHPSTQSRKKKRLRKILGEVPSYVRFVPVDFERENLADAMAGAGFSPGARTIFVWEGVTQYIPSEAVDTTFRYVARTGGEQSGMVFTYIRADIIDGSARTREDEKIMSLTKRTGVPWVFGIDPRELPAYLAERGLEIVEEVGTQAYRERYLDPLGREMRVYEGERVAVAGTAEGPDSPRPR